MESTRPFIPLTTVSWPTVSPQQIKKSYIIGAEKGECIQKEL